MKRIWLLIFCIFSEIMCGKTYTEEMIPTKYPFRFSGFIRNDLIADTRLSYQPTADPLLVVPFEPQFDPKGVDINDVTKFTITPLRSYLRLDVFGPQFSTTDVHICMQFDFFGPQLNQENIVHFWYMYGELFNECEQLIIGQYRHPFRPLRVYPNALTYNPATIEQAPQIRWRHDMGKGVDTILAIFSELNFASFGVNEQAVFFAPDGAIVRSPSYMQNSMKPGIAGRIEYNDERWVAGAGLLGFTVLPRLSSEKGYPNSFTATCCWTTAYAGYYGEKVEVKGQLIWAQNFAPLYPVGGYVARCSNTSTGLSEYRPLQNIFSWLDIESHSHRFFKPGLYLEYCPIVGSGHTFIDPVSEQATVYGLNGRLQSITRICPRLMVDICEFNMGFEYDYIRANYGTLNADGRFVNTAPVSMGRFMFVCWCFIS